MTGSARTHARVGSTSPQPPTHAPARPDAGATRIRHIETFMKHAFAVVLLFASCSASAASFDCRKAATFVEKEICTNLVLSKLDDTLADNYKMMLLAEVGADTRAAQKAIQKAWLRTRNACTDYACIEKNYRQRIDAICEVPVLEGPHPPCAMAESVDW